MKSFTGSEPLFINTWAWLVLAKRDDSNHAAVKRLLAESTHQGGRWITTDYVLDEAITRLFAGSPFHQAEKFLDGIFESSATGKLTIEPVTAERFQAAWQLRLRYKDKPRISFTDLTSFVIMRDLGIHHVLTGDAHFAHAGLGFQVLPSSRT